MIHDSLEKCYMVYFSECHNYCYQNIKSFTNSFYRNKSYSHYFCSQECKNLFEKEYRCNECCNTSNIVLEKDGLAYCTSTDYWEFSCHEKHLIHIRSGESIECIHPFCNFKGRWKCLNDKRYNQICRKAPFCNEHKDLHLEYQDHEMKEIWHECKKCDRIAAYECQTDKCDNLELCENHAVDHIIDNNTHKIVLINNEIEWKCLNCNDTFKTYAVIEHIKNNKDHIIKKF